MLVGYLVSATLGGMLAAISLAILGTPLAMVLLSYSLTGMAGMLVFGLSAHDPRL